MQIFKSLFGVASALGPVVYFAGLAFYFLDQSSSFDDAVTNGLGPTVIGLGALGIFFCVPLLMKIWRLYFDVSRSVRSSKRADADDAAFDADAVLARYMAKQAEAVSDTAAVPAGRGSQPRPSFGRKGT